MTKTLDQQIHQWLAEGEIGLSSQTIAFWVGFGVLPEDHNHPLDPSDFNRCLKLLETAPGLRPNLHKMASLSPEWSRLIEHWDAIETVFLEEAGLGFTKARIAPRTGALMKELINA